MPSLEPQVPPLYVVLVAPEIAPNTGNIARTCAAVGAELHLVRPLGFFLTDRALRRAGMDYWQQVAVGVHDDWDACRKALAPVVQNWYYFLPGGNRRYDEATYGPASALVFGSESKGLPEFIVAAADAGQRLRLPMRRGIRSLNLANAVAVVAYEARRQQGFAGMG